jgi:hypothetical protein
MVLAESACLRFGIMRSHLTQDRDAGQAARPDSIFDNIFSSDSSRSPSRGGLSERSQGGDGNQDIFATHRA